MFHHLLLLQCHSLNHPPSPSFGAGAWINGSMDGVAGEAKAPFLFYHCLCMFQELCRCCKAIHYVVFQLISDLYQLIGL